MTRHVTPRIVALVLCGVLTATALTSCGTGNSESGSTASVALTRSQFIRQANQLCQRAMAEKDGAVSSTLKDLPPRVENAPSREDLTRVAEQAVLPAYKRAVDQLKNLGLPRENKSQARKVIMRFEAALEAAEAEPLMLVRSNPFVYADEAAHSYGLGLCNL